MADDTAVLRNGLIEEIGATQDVFERPQADYTQKLLALTPVMPKDWHSS
jgi:peptide/nickel transport system ATP-binding protein